MIFSVQSGVKRHLNLLLEQHKDLIEENICKWTLWWSFCSQKISLSFVWCAYFLWHCQTFPLQNTKDFLSLSLFFLSFFLTKNSFWRKIGVLSTEDDRKRKEKLNIVLLWMLSKCNGCLGKNTCHCFANLLFNILVTRKQNVIVVFFAFLNINTKSPYSLIKRHWPSWCLSKYNYWFRGKIQMCDEWLIN